MESTNTVVTNAWQAYQPFSQLPIKKRVDFMKMIGAKLLLNAEMLAAIAQQETNLSKERLISEINRTVFQLNNYADAALKGDWLDLSIQKGTVKDGKTILDIRKTNTPIGPVLVFGSSNFPFAYSTAGGDTASALAAGCSVIVKAHEAHVKTSVAVAQCIAKAIVELNMPQYVFQHIIAQDRTEVNEYIVHPKIKAIGFTGSFAGGKAIWELANSRKEPIPMFAEMSSINPVCILPDKLHQNVETMAATFLQSILLDAGQFCTNPGIMIAIDNADLEQLLSLITVGVETAVPQKMLHAGIAHSFYEKRKSLLMDDAVQLVATTQNKCGKMDVIPTIAAISAQHFLQDEKYTEEVFGSFTLVVKCNDVAEMIHVLDIIPGQLTTTLWATDAEVHTNFELVQHIQEKCGRFILNGVPTGVTVTQAMQHGGPWPATTDSRFTSVGADAIKRFVRPVSYQNWSDALLPLSLQNKNPLGYLRSVDGNLITDSIE